MQAAAQRVPEEDRAIGRIDELLKRGKENVGTL